MKKTVIRQIIERLEDAQKHIIANTDYANGYDRALSDAITVCESFLEKEKKQIIDFAVWFNNNDNTYKSYEEIVNKYYNSIFGDSNEAGI